MAVVSAGFCGRISAACALGLVLAGCGFSSLYIDLDANTEDDEIWFEDPSQSWFTNHCVRNVTVTRYDLGEDAEESERIYWRASGQGTECVVTVPFRYGELERTPDRNRRYTPARPLDPGASYEIEVELSNGAGSGGFTVNQDGTITNDN